MTGSGAGEADGTSAGDVADRVGADAGGDGAVIAGGENVGEAGEVFDLLHRLVFIGKLKQIEIGVGNHDIFSLPPYPSAHVHVTVGGAGACGIHVQANSGFAFFAIPATAARDVERNGDDVAFFDEFDVAAGFDHFAGDFMAEDQPSRRGGSAAHHVLVRAADVGGDDLEQHSVLAFMFVGGIDELGKIDGFNFDFARFDVSDAA